jgi:hypothetical protein
MKNFKSIILSIALVSMFAACNKDKCIDGTGGNVSRNYNMADFNALSIYGDAQVTVTKGADRAVRIEAQDNVLNALNVAITSGTLNIGKDNCFKSGTNKLKIYVTTPTLTGLTSSGSVDIISNDLFTENSFSTVLSGTGSMDINIDVDNFQSSVSGTGTIMAKGNATAQLLTSSGEANFKCFDLIGEDVDIDVSGTANAEVHATKTLNIEVSGSATIYYKGQPSITQNISGTATIIDAN